MNNSRQSKKAVAININNDNNQNNKIYNEWYIKNFANNIEALGDELLNAANKETNLPLPRLTGERGRTCFQLRMFANMLRKGDYVDATIDTAVPDKTPPKPDIRQMLYPLGPVVVFGASNFPFAYSTAGGDTASALAAGCPVIVKAHPAHLQTSTLVAEAIQQAIKSNAIPEHTFQHITETDFSAGKALVQDENIAAVGFTGSRTGGRALYDYASARKNPIPVFAEMGSVNPVFLFPEKLLCKKKNGCRKDYIDYYFLNSFSFVTEYEFYHYYNNSKTVNNEYDFLTASLIYQKKDSKLEYKVSGTNLLNTTALNDDSFSQFSTRTSQYAVQPRYIIFSLKYNSSKTYISIYFYIRNDQLNNQFRF